MRLTILCALVAILCSGCGVPVPNPLACSELPSGRARCKRPLDEKSEAFFKSSSQWRRERVGQICFEPLGWAEIAKFIEDACNKNQNCVYKAKTKAAAFYNGMRRP